MNASRVARPGALQLSPRYRHLRRLQSTTPTPQQPIATPIAQTATPSNPSFLRRNGIYILGSTALATGLAAGFYLSHTLAPPALPEPGTHEDKILLDDLNTLIDAEFKVNVLRGKCLGVAKQLKGEQGGWVELVTPAINPTPDIPPSTTTTNTLRDTLSGARGITVERIFYNHADDTLIAVMWFGGAMGGWPGVTHGGILSTVLADKFALVNHLNNGDGPTTTILSGPNSHAKSPLPPPSQPLPTPAQISMTYKKPTFANAFYVVRVAPAEPSSPLESLTDPTHNDGRVAGPNNLTHPVRAREYQATIETTAGVVCVKAQAKFAPRGEGERAADKLRDQATRSVQELKAWMWPSRQKESFLK